MKRILGFSRPVVAFCTSGPFFLLVIPLIGFKAFYWGTAGLQFIPWTIEAARDLYSGVFPWWNPLNGMGAPLVANYQLAIFYPPNWLLYFLYGLFDGAGVAWGYTFLTWLHLSFSALGMAFFVKKFNGNDLGQVIAGLSYGLSAYFVNRIGFFSIIWTASWLPWVAVIVFDLSEENNPLRRKEQSRLIGLGALTMAFMLLAGHAQTTLYAILLLSAFSFRLGWRSSNLTGALKSLIKFGLMVLLGALIAAIQLFPTTEYLFQSQRASAVAYDAATTYSFWPWHFLTLITPGLFGTPQTGDYVGYGAYWEDSIYIGVLTFLIAFTTLHSIKVKKSVANIEWVITFFWVAILAVILIMLGKFTPVFHFLYQYIPTFNLFQAPARIAVIMVFSLCVLAGIAISNWKTLYKQSPKLLKFGSVAGIGIVIAGLWASFFMDGIAPSVSKALVIYGFLITANSLLLIYFNNVNQNNIKKTFLFWSPAFLLLIDLLIAGWNSVPTIAASSFNTIQNAASNSRIFLLPQAEYQIKFNRFVRFEDSRPLENFTDLIRINLPNLNLINATAMVNNFDPLIPSRFSELLTSIESMTVNQRNQWLNWMDVGTVLDYAPDSADGLEEQHQLVYSRFHFFPCSTRVQEYDLSNYLLETNNSQQYIILEEQPILNPTDCSFEISGDVEILRENANFLQLQVNLDHAGYLMVADSWYPGWMVKSDGDEIHLFRANYLFRAVYLNAGSHIVEFSYRPTHFYVSLVISLSTFVFVIFLLLNLKNTTEGSQKND